MALTMILSRYFTLRFLRAVMLFFFTCTMLILLVDFVELTRKSADKENIHLTSLIFLALLRTPSLSEQILPFAILFGAMGSILSLNRKFEIIIARAAGLSAWQFLMPLAITAFIIGTVSTIAYNPLAATLKDKAETLKAELFGDINIDENKKQTWFRQTGIDGESIIQADASTNQGERLNGVTVFSYDRNGNFSERMQAKTALLMPGHWQLESVWLKRTNEKMVFYPYYTLSTNMKPEHIREFFASPSSVSFWHLPFLIKIAQQAGLPAFRYRLQYQSLLAQPLLFCAMVLIAATVSMRVFRFGNIGRLILGGVIAGFVLYVFRELAEDFGVVGIIHPGIAAWLPAIIASLFGLTILLHQEDG